MSNYIVRRDEYGHAAAIERDGYTVLQLQSGTERNEQEVDRIVARLNGATEPTGAERVREAIADRYQNALRGWRNPVDRAAGSYYNGYLNGVRDTLRILGITIPGITDGGGDR